MARGGTGFAAVTKVMLKLVGAVATGNALGQALQLIAQPYIAGLYPAAEFGIVAQISAVASVIAVVGTLQMHTAVVVSRDRSVAAELFGVGLLASIVTFTAVAFLFGACRREIFGDSDSRSIAVSCAFLVLSLCYANTLKGWQLVVGAYSALSIFALVRAVLVVVLQVTFGIYHLEAGLVLGLICGELASLAILSALGTPPSRKAVARGMSPRVAWRHIKKFKDFAFSGTLQEIAAVAVLMMPSYMFVRQYSVSVGGQFAMAHKFVWAPVALIGAAMAQVLYRHFAQLDPDALRGSQWLRWGRAPLAIVLGAVAFAAVVPAGMTLLLGDEWADAAWMSRWIVVWGGAFLLSIPSRVCYRVLRLQRIQMAVDAGTAVLLLGAFLGATLSSATMMLVVTGVGVMQNAALVAVIAVKVRQQVEAVPTTGVP